MLNHVVMQNFGPLHQLNWANLQGINLIIGKNSSGKTFLLKALYCGMRALEEYKRGNEPRTAAEILAEKLYWTFQADKIGDLVSKGADAPLACHMGVDNQHFHYSFGPGTTKNISFVENHVTPRESNSIFLPPKEVLSLQHIILTSREQEKVFGFDDTYYDLVKALRIPTKRGINYKTFADARFHLESMLDGKIEFDENANRWQFKKGNQRFNIGVTAEGVKKIAILDTLLGNRFLSPESVIFIDEPESALHPAAIVQLLDIVAALASQGIQFFIATHSYFVIKKLYLIAQEHSMSIPLLSAVDNTWQQADLKAGMPDNPIIAESVELYREEVSQTLA